MAQGLLRLVEQEPEPEAGAEADAVMSVAAVFPPEGFHANASVITGSAGAAFNIFSSMFTSTGPLDLGTVSVTGERAPKTPSGKPKGDVMPDPTREEIDAKLAALEARSEARLERVLKEVHVSHATLAGELKTAQAELGGKISTSMAKLQEELRGDFRALEARTAGKLTVILTGVSTVLAIGGIVVAVIIGLAATGQQMFGLGQSTHDIAAAAGQAAAQQVLDKVKH